MDVFERRKDTKRVRFHEKDLKRKRRGGGGGANTQTFIFEVHRMEHLCKTSDKLQRKDKGVGRHHAGGSRE